jgi:hypothetical protein
MPPLSNRKRHFLEAVTLSALRDSELTIKVREFVANLNYRRFVADDTLDKRVALHDAVRVYLESGDRIAAQAAITESFDMYGIKQELMDDVSRTAMFMEITETIAERVSSGRPDLVADDMVEVIGRTTLGHIADEIVSADRSNPLDIAVGKQVTVCYIPGSSEAANYWDIATTSWLPKSDSLSIYPDRTFLDFLSVVGLNKSEWMAAVDRNVTSGALGRMNHLHAERIAAWARVEDWAQNGSLEVDVDDVVAAVDACPYGFTPMIAFTMDADEVFSMDFTDTLEVTGGIVGLHDFTNGSGDPIRFEGTLKLSPSVRDMHLADDQPLGLIATHGFLSSSFQSTVQRVSEPSRKADAATPRP